MERIYRLIFLVLFILGFIGAVAGVGRTDESVQGEKSPVASLIKDVKLAEEINEINEGRWNQDVSDLNQDGISRVENLNIDEAQEDSTSRVKSDLSE